MLQQDAVEKIRDPSPHGEGGLKPGAGAERERELQSLPTRGGWIETSTVMLSLFPTTDPSPHGEGGLKPVHFLQLGGAVPNPSPHGEGGLKQNVQRDVIEQPSIPPHTGRVD